jgi:hypothetical protein
MTDKAENDSHAKRGAHDKRLFRIIAILHRLGCGGSFDFMDLTAEFSISTRTVQRDIALLNQVGLPLVRDCNGRYRFLDRFKFMIPLPRKELVPGATKNRGNSRTKRDFSQLKKKGGGERGLLS